MVADQIRELLHTRPFRPFNVHTNDGHVLKVPHTGFAWLMPDNEWLFVYTDHCSELVVVENIALVSVEKRSAKAKAKAA